MVRSRALNKIVPARALSRYHKDLRRAQWRRTGASDAETYTALWILVLAVWMLSMMLVMVGPLSLQSIAEVTRA